MNREMAGKVVLVTGASKGIGAAIAEAFGRTGATVMIAYANDRDGAARVAALIEGSGGRAATVRCDLARPAEAEAMVATTVSTFGSIDVLVNNAGVFDYKPLPEITPEHFHSLFDTNVLGLLMATRAAVATFNADGGSVINISSLAAHGNAPGRAIYTATKAAVNAITKVLALELATRMIRVNAIMPGYVDTEGSRAFGLPGSAAEAQLIAATPLARPGRPSDIGSIALFLASTASAWMTGEILTAAGGLR